MRSHNALCLFVKAPRLGEVKTRMQPQLSPRDTLSLYKAMAEDLLERIDGHREFDLHPFFFPPDCAVDIGQWLGNKYKCLPQEGDDLGSRMHNAFRWTRARAYRKTIIVGSDIPMLDAGVITAALDCLDASDVVLGPSRDGGYYLIGMREPHRELFREISWGTGRVYRETLEKILRQGLSVDTVPELDDLDTFEDVCAFWQRVRTSSEFAESKRTSVVLSSLFDDRL
jgi:rSAM/selenodomain-associated transferase 1